MKKFSKESMQSFMLMHAEKLILGGCLAATGLVVYMSLGGENDVKDTPSQLLQKANSAQQYIDREAWQGDELLQAYRKGEVDAKGKIVKAKRVDPDLYSLKLLGTPAAALAKRLDPEIFGPEQLIAKRFTAGVMIDNPEVRSPLGEFNKAPEGADGGEGAFKGFGGRDGDDYGGEDFGGQSSAGGTGLPEDYPALPRSGIFNEVNAITARGIRPSELGIAAPKITTSVLDVVCVTAVVDFQKQTAAFEKAFAESIAFNVKRDRPIYQFLQVQRREVSDAETQWQDISENVSYTYPRLCPSSLSKMPLQMFRSAPEVIAPENYDPILSGVIPAFAMLDYQQIASHPALKLQREFPAWEPPKKKMMLGSENDVPGGMIFKRNNDASEDSFDSRGMGDDSDVNAMRRGSETTPYKEAIALRKPGGQYRLVRFFDLNSPQNTSFEYRIRVWVGDPNQADPSNGFQKDRGKRLEASREGGVKFVGTTDAGMETGMDEMNALGQEDEFGMQNKSPERVQDVTPTMTAPAVRKRIAAASGLETMMEQMEQSVLAQKPMEPFYVSEFSEAGKLEKINLPTSPSRFAYTRYLRFARPSAWSESVRVERKRPPADVYAGPTVRSRSFSMDAGAGKVEFEFEEPKVDLVVSSWVWNMGAKLPSNRSVYVGETLDFNAPAYVTHPISWEVLAGENPRINDSEGIRKYILPIRTGTTVVDAFFGRQLELPNNKKLTMEMPTELLTMDANGRLTVSNEFDAATDYRNEITEKDSSRFYGRARKKKEVKDEYDDYGADL